MKFAVNFFSCGNIMKIRGVKNNDLHVIHHAGKVFDIFHQMPAEDH